MTRKEAHTIQCIPGHEMDTLCGGNQKSIDHLFKLWRDFGAGHAETQLWLHAQIGMRT